MCPLTFSRAETFERNARLLSRDTCDATAASPTAIEMHSPDASTAAYCPMFKPRQFEPKKQCTVHIRPKIDANGRGGMMLSVSTNCPKCQHTFSLGVCAGGTGGSCRDGLALSGGGLVWPPTPSPTLVPQQPIFFQSTSPPEQDLNLLVKTDARLRISGWYYQDLTWQASQIALKDTASGTFLIRDSSDHKFLYSLSVQTMNGPTSVRIHYNSGQFRLDSQPALAASMPLFDCVVKLIEHYVKVTCYRDKENKKENGKWASTRGHVWVDAGGDPHSPVEVRKPLLLAPPKLGHAARLAVWRGLRDASPPALPLLSPIRQLGLPLPLQNYLEEYPYTC